MKTLLVLFVIIIAAQAEGQVAGCIKPDFTKINLKEDVLYFFCRGTKGKAGLLTKKFNLQDTNITHTGIGFYENGEALIYNVSDVAKGFNGALYVDSLKSFINTGDVYYVSVWEYKVTHSDYNTLKNALKAYSGKHITFDRFFNVSFDDTLYCSEFCINILNRLKIPELSFTATKYNLEKNILYESYLERRELIYYPVDFFTVNKRIKKIFELQLKPL